MYCKLVLQLIFTFCITNIIAQSKTLTNTYTASTELIANPERGFYHHTEIQSSTTPSLNLATLINYRETEQITQILRVIYLTEFVERPISAAFLSNLHKDFNTIREAGLKVIIRFAYSKGTEKPYGDATPEMVRNHVNQLKEVISTHKDVIAAIQAGFVGTWGEWYYTTHFADGDPWIVSDKNWTDRANLVNDLLHIIPKDRALQLRTPVIKKRIFESDSPITAPYNETNVIQARVGHHNDCFVASQTDLGTYTDLESDKAYLEAETKYLPMGGETCRVASPYSDCENAYAELVRFHWSYMNIDYNQNVLDVWKTQGCFDDVERNLGYRFVLEESNLEQVIHPQSSFQLSITLKNQGFANPYNPRNVEILLESELNQKTYRVKTKEKFSDWPIQQTFTRDIEAGLPTGIANGDYKVYLWMPDASPLLENNPAYAIQCANVGTWDSSTGWNNLGLTLTVDDTESISAYQGDLFFSSTSAEPTQISGPSEIYTAADASEAILFWGRSTDHTTRYIQESDDQITYSTIAVIPAINDVYRITPNESAKYYRYILENENGEQAQSNSIFIENDNQAGSLLNIATDGNDTDWSTTIPTASALDDNFNSYVLRSHFASSAVHFGIYGNIDDYQIYLNTDQNTETGSTTTDITQGMDYLIQSGELLAYTDGGWNPITDMITTSKDQMLEISFDINQLTNIGDNNLIPIVGYLNNGTIQLSDNVTTPAKIVRQNPSDIPINFIAQNSVDFPDERIEIFWTACAHCSSYELERSENGTDFELIKELSADRDYYFDDFLPTGTYYYRIRSSNVLGYSDYSNIASVNLSTATFEAPFNNEFNVWPSPSSGIFYIDFDYDKVYVYDIRGILITVQDQISNEINLTAKNDGMYLLKFVKDEKAWGKKVFILR